MKYSIQENQDGTHSILRYGKPVHWNSGIPNNVEFEFWQRIQELEQELEILKQSVATPPEEKLSKNAPTQPGFYWALWISASPKTLEGSECIPAPDWCIVEVWLNHLGPKNSEQFGVFVPGVRETQWLENFVWGPSIQKPDLTKYQ